MNNDWLRQRGIGMMTGCLFPVFSQERRAAPVPFMSHPKLSHRESDCLHWAAAGKTSWETGVILGVSERTVNFHLQNACRKLRVCNRRAAVATALRQGLLNDGRE